MDKKRGKVSKNRYFRKTSGSKGVEGRKTQVTIFVIVAIILVGAIVLFFALREDVEEESLSKEFKVVEDKFLDCLQERTVSGISMLEEKGGYIYLPQFEAGNSFMPQGSQLDFMGSPIPYWYYVSGGNVVKEQMPSKGDMERQMERYLEENMACDFSGFRREGYLIEIGEKDARVEIRDKEVRVDLEADLRARYGNQSVIIKDHNEVVESELGSFYETAKTVILKEKENRFLENYTLDTLHSYAPVTGVELSCSPKTWVKREVKEELASALQANIGMLRPGGYEGDKKYFNLGLDSDEDIQFMYNKEWPTKIEVVGEGEIMEAEPVGEEVGMQMFGACYTPYHFVYNVAHPVMVQVYGEGEIFQFPLVVVIRRNRARDSIEGSSLRVEEPEVCKYRNQEMEVYTFGGLEPVEAEIKFKCFNQECKIGRTEMGEDYAYLKADFPQCVNGVVISKADGYEDGKARVSTNEKGEVDIVMDKLYEEEVDLIVDGKETDKRSVVQFKDKDGKIRSLLWPEQKEISLSEGSYNISVKVYQNSSLYFDGKNTKKCVEVAKPGILGIFGSKSEKCYDINIPGQEISNVLFAGGETDRYITQSELEKGRVEIGASSLEMPSNIEELGKLYTKIDREDIYLEFRE